MLNVANQRAVRRRVGIYTKWVRGCGEWSEFSLVLFRLRNPNKPDAPTVEWLGITCPDTTEEDCGSTNPSVAGRIGRLQASLPSLLPNDEAVCAFYAWVKMTHELFNEVMYDVDGYKTNVLEVLHNTPAGVKILQQHYMVREDIYARSVRLKYQEALRDLVNLPNELLREREDYKPCAYHEDYDFIPAGWKPEVFRVRNVPARGVQDTERLERMFRNHVEPFFPVPNAADDNPAN